MTKLKLGPLADDRPIKLTVELPATVHRDLVAYAAALAAERTPPSILLIATPKRFHALIDPGKAN